ncbi:hypothetical protein HNO88_002232 [Novosphingobium chloroacetimidivorans]|uniref:Uncharacterized protein n=1 Tax=Novosphingobium chloroacetimidivorans TaxID=1428314 RepID=A0A7W7NW24_9SPHN|nr:hypothetical protein [Novosphingobium chloroacetimidivorans]MBB4858906.1 hypothetical protein [Novosphingobium chloroacetimidivorans]
MHAVTDADREAAEELRVLLAEVSGFWHTHGDTGPICMALARHRELAERRLLENMEQPAQRPSVISVLQPAREPAVGVREAPLRRQVRSVAIDRHAVAAG